MLNQNKLTLPLGKEKNPLDIENAKLRSTISILKSELMKHISLDELNNLLNQSKPLSAANTNENGSNTLDTASKINQSYSNDNNTVTPTSAKFNSITKSSTKMSSSPSTLGLSSIMRNENVAPPRSRNRQSDSSPSNQKAIENLQFNHSDVSLTEAILEEDDEKCSASDYHTQHSLRSPVEQDLLKNSDSASDDSDDEFSLNSLTNKNTDRSVKIKGPHSEERAKPMSRPISPISIKSPRLLDTELMDLDTFSKHTTQNSTQADIQSSISQSINDFNKSFSSQFLDLPKENRNNTNNAMNLIKENDDIIARENLNHNLDLKFNGNVLKPPKSPAPRSNIFEDGKTLAEEDRRNSEMSYNSSIQLSPSPSIMMTPKMNQNANVKVKGLSPSPDLKPAKIEENNKPATSTTYTTSRIQIQSQNSLSTIKSNNVNQTPPNLKVGDSNQLTSDDHSQRSSMYANSIQLNQNDGLLISPRAKQLQSPRSASKNRHNVIYDNKLHSPMRLEPLDLSEVESDFRTLNDYEKLQLGIDIVKPEVKKPSVVKNEALFVQPNELQNVEINLLSCIHYLEDTNPKELGFLFRVIDKTSNKSLYEFSKKYEQIVKLLGYLQRYTKISLDIPSFQRDEDGFVPKQIIGRHTNINNIIRHAVRFGVDSDNLSVLIKLAEFISTNISINTFGNDLLNFTKFNNDEVKVKLENYCMVKRYKTIGSASPWKCRSVGLIAENNNFWIKFLDLRNSIQEGLKLSSQTSLEFFDNNEQDLEKYGCYNGFYISENGKKSSIGGSKNNNKLYLSFETREIRDNWIKALYQIIKTGSLSNMELQQRQVFSDVQSTKSNDSNDTNTSARKHRMRSLFPFNKKDINTHAGEYNTETHSNDTAADSTIVEGHASDGEATEDNNKIFGNFLQYALMKSSKKYNEHVVPSIIHNCIERLYMNDEYYLKEQGIFRISGSSLTIKNLMEKYDKDFDVDLRSYDIHVVCSLMKTYLRNIPDQGGILGNQRSSCVDKLKEVCEQQSVNNTKVADVIKEMKKVLWNRDYIDVEHLDLCAVLFELLNKISLKSDSNKMNLRNLIIVFAPTLDLPVDVLAHFIRDYRYLFIEEESFDESINRDDIKVNIPGM